jgi:hypothetical protein
MKAIYRQIRVEYGKHPHMATLRLGIVCLSSSRQVVIFAKSSSPCSSFKSLARYGGMRIARVGFDSEFVRFGIDISLI